MTERRKIKKIGRRPNETEKKIEMNKEKNNKNPCKSYVIKQHWNSCLLVLYEENDKQKKKKKKKSTELASWVDEVQYGWVCEFYKVRMQCMEEF